MYTKFNSKPHIKPSTIPDKMTCFYPGHQKNKGLPKPGSLLIKQTFKQVIGSVLR